MSAVSRPSVNTLQFKLVSDSVSRQCSQRHGNRSCRVHVKHTWVGEHRVTTPFLDVVDSGTALNTGADVPSADVGVEGLEFLIGWSYQVYYFSDGSFSSGTVLSASRPQARVRHACYCPETDDFVQQVSVMVVFVTKLCDPLWLDCAIVEGSQSVTAGTNSRSILAGATAK